MDWRRPGLASQYSGFVKGKSSNSLIIEVDVPLCFITQTEKAKRT